MRKIYTLKNGAIIRILRQLLISRPKEFGVHRNYSKLGIRGDNLRNESPSGEEVKGRHERDHSDNIGQIFVL